MNKLYTKKQRREIYLKAARKSDGKGAATKYLLSKCGRDMSMDAFQRRNMINKSFLEVSLLNNADYDFVDYMDSKWIEETRVTALLLCAQMCR